MSRFPRVAVALTAVIMVLQGSAATGVAVSAWDWGSISGSVSEGIKSASSGDKDSTRGPGGTVDRCEVRLSGGTTTITAIGSIDGDDSKPPQDAIVFPVAPAEQPTQAVMNGGPGKGTYTAQTGTEVRIDGVTKWDVSVSRPTIGTDREYTGKITPTECTIYVIEEDQ